MYHRTGMSLLYSWFLPWQEAHRSTLNSQSLYCSTSKSTLPLSSISS
ncbi:MAG: hypothetical protein GXO88_01680 [Chlorobi bacterium]|nr:hypothetical protein [Chlorobiota bacterium]